MVARTTPLEGGCACGRVRYRLAARPLFVQACHCRACQRDSSSAFSLHALIEEEQLRLLQGRPQAVERSMLSGHARRVHVCPQCQVVLWSDGDAPGESVVHLRVGTLDDPDRLVPDLHVHVAERLRWLALPRGTPSVPQSYDAPDYWSAGSLRRRAALRARMTWAR